MKRLIASILNRIRHNRQDIFKAVTLDYNKYFVFTSGIVVDPDYNLKVFTRCLNTFLYSPVEREQMRETLRQRLSMFRRSIRFAGSQTSHGNRAWMIMTLQTMLNRLL